MFFPDQRQPVGQVDLAPRFEFEANLASATLHGHLRSPIWPPAATVQLLTVDLSADAPALSPRFYALLNQLGDYIDEEWRHSKAGRAVPGDGFVRAADIARVMRAAAAELEHPVDKAHLLARAECVAHGYTDARLSELADSDGRVAVFAAPLATWYGKEVARRPTAFACSFDAEIGRALARLSGEQTLREYLGGLRAGLLIKPGPTFIPSRLFFMAGEGNLHPKHIAYFLPEDEGVKRSPFKKTYYFANTHQRLLEGVSNPLFDAIVDLGAPRFESPRTTHILPAAGVYGHELGHFVLRSNTSYATTNRSNRWVSVAMQEVCADVFGILFVAQCWAEELELTVEEVVAYYLAECLRYVNRGLGYFPDSDGMFLQLNYLHTIGALDLSTGPTGVRLRAKAPDVIAGLRSLARVLADSLLDNQLEFTLRLFERYGPSNREALSPLLQSLGRAPVASVEYIAEHIGPQAQSS